MGCRVGSSDLDKSKSAGLCLNREKKHGKNRENTEE